MKTLINSFRTGLIILSVLSFYSCEKKSTESNGTGTAEFSISLPDGTGLTKSAMSVDSAIVSFQLMVSVEDLAGNAVVTDELIPLFTFGTGFVSENLEIKSGEYRLTKIMVINPSGEVVLAAPKAGSALAYLTTRPLPFNFTVLPYQALVSG